MHDCDHNGSRVYARRRLPDGSIHICVQCVRCLQLVRLPEHNNRPYLSLAEVPAGRSVYDWIEQADAK